VVHAASNKRRRTSALEAAPAQTTVVDTASAVFEFNVNYEKVKHLDAGKPICYDAISAGGHMWRLRLRYHLMNQNREKICIALFLELLSRSSSVSAIFEVMLIDNDGKPVANAAERTAHRAESCASIVWLHQPATGTVLPVQKYVKDGKIKFLCTIRVLHDGSSSIPAPPPDIVRHLGELLDTADGTDVAFAVDGETFHAHRALLAARSPSLCMTSPLQRSKPCPVHVHRRPAR
jgi:speckle-type POZ protein